MSETRLKIAVFIDFDNIEIGVKTTLGGHFDVGAVLEAIKERGEVVTKVAYGDWTRAGDYSRSLTQHAIHMVQRNLTPGGDKNGADINLALDALEMAFTHNHINAFVIVGGDSDFMALVEKLKQYDRKVFVVGGRAFTSVILQKNCTEFIAYENLVGAAPRKSGGRAGGRPGETPAVQAVPLIRRALKVLADREVSPQLGVLKSTLLQLDSTFSEREYGASTFRDFVQRLARAGYLTLKGTDRNIYVELREGADGAAAAAALPGSAAAVGSSGSAAPGSGPGASPGAVAAARGSGRDGEALAADAAGDSASTPEGEVVARAAAGAGARGLSLVSGTGTKGDTEAGAGASEAVGVNGSATSTGHAPARTGTLPGDTDVDVSTVAGDVDSASAKAETIDSDADAGAPGASHWHGSTRRGGAGTHGQRGESRGEAGRRHRDGRASEGHRGEGRRGHERDFAPEGGREADGNRLDTRGADDTGRRSDAGAGESDRRHEGGRYADGGRGLPHGGGSRRDQPAQSAEIGGPAGTPADALRFISDVFHRPGIVSRWPLYLRQVKQILRSVDETFDERRYGFTGIVEALRYCQREGLFRLDRDRQGVLRVYPGPALQRSPATVPPASDVDSAPVAGAVSEVREERPDTAGPVPDAMNLFPPTESPAFAEGSSSVTPAEETPDVLERGDGISEDFRPAAEITETAATAASSVADTRDAAQAKPARRSPRSKTVAKKSAVKKTAPKPRAAKTATPRKMAAKATAS